MTVQVERGQVLVGKYRVERVLGQGGMGFVVAARHEQLDQLVALKFLLPEALANPDTLARFFREARLASKLRGEHVARVLDVAQLESGSPFIVMEYLEGEDLDELLYRDGPLPAEEAVGLLLQACEGLAEAHSKGIVHRDLKPANLFLARLGDGSLCVKLLDFGISKATEPQHNSYQTRAPSLPGTPHYMAPEQMRGSRAPDPRSDLWSLGVILYELLTGLHPFDGGSVAELSLAVLNQPPLSPRSLRPELPEGLEQVVLRCLEKNVGARFQSVAELASALGPFAPSSRGAAGRVSRTLELPRPLAPSQAARETREMEATLAAPLPVPAPPAALPTPAQPSQLAPAQPSLPTPTPAQIAPEPPRPAQAQPAPGPGLHPAQERTLPLPQRASGSRLPEQAPGDELELPLEPRRPLRRYGLAAAVAAACAGLLALALIPPAPGVTPAPAPAPDASPEASTRPSPAPSAAPPATTAAEPATSPLLPLPLPPPSPQTPAMTTEAKRPSPPPPIAKTTTRNSDFGGRQ